MNRNRWLAGLVLGTALAAPAMAHVTLAEDTVVAGRYAKLAFRVGHGCDGLPSRRVEIHMPDGFWVAKPQPKPGWVLAIRTRPVTTAATVHGKPVTEVVAQVTWEGGSLPDDQFDEFALMVRAPDEPGDRPIRVRQVCDKGEHDWREVADSPGARPRSPAPVLKVVPAPAGEHKH
jgi:uncharacterized protein YcnI